MSRTTERARALMALAAATVIATVAPATGCIDANFDPPHLVKSPRLLAISADPPESEFGQDVTFAALLVDADGSDLAAQPDVTLTWTVCISLNEVLNASGLGALADLEDNCTEGGDELVRLSTDGLAPNEARLPGTAFFGLIADLMGAMMPPPGTESPLDPQVAETLSLVLGEVGVPLRVRVEVRRGGEILANGFKRFAVTTRLEPTTNPPPPRFAVNGVWLTARTGGDPHFCVPEEGDRPVVDPEAEVDLTPDPDEDVWIEQYPVFALDGTLQINQESAYYSWFTTAGVMGSEITRRPERDAVWTAPAEAGRYPIWLVVRDGHLGLVWCQAEVEVR